MTSPFVSEVQELIIHWGFTHSVFFSVLAAPLLGWLLNRYSATTDIRWKNCSLLVFLVLLSHIFIDVCTSYGTQVLQPFSNYSLSLNSIFIIDLFYSLPLMGRVLTAKFLHRNSASRRWANGPGLAISSLYLLAGLGIKAHVNTVFEQNFAEQDIHPQKYMTTPAPFSTFLWTGYAEKDDTYICGAVFDF